MSEHDWNANYASNDLPWDTGQPDPVLIEAIEAGLACERVRRIVGLPDTPAPALLRPFMFPGLHVFEPEIFSWMDAGAAFSVTRVTYPRLLAAGRAIYGYATGARWVTIDTPEALAAADAEVTRRPFRFDPVLPPAGKR